MTTMGIISKKTVTATGADPTKSYEFRYRVVPLDSLIASHDEALGTNPKFPKELQPRIRSREASRQQIKRIASQLQPQAMLTDVGTLDRGPMIVGPDLVVESGNGRTIALKIAALEFPDKFKAYTVALKEQAREYGLKSSDIDKVKQPVLVRERITEVDRVEFTARANEAQTLTMSPLEQALQDSGRISDTDLAALKVSDLQSIDAALKATNNRPLVAKFLKGLPPNEQAALMGSSGELNILGLQRLKAAMFARVYPGEAGQRLTLAFFESIDPSVKNVENALFDSLPQMAQAEGLVRSGQRNRDLSLANDIAKAVDMLARLKQQGMSVEDFLAQKGLFGSDLSPAQENMLAFLSNNARSRKRIREFMRSYAEGVIAAPHPQQGAMFRTATETKPEMLDRLIGKHESEAMGANVGLFGLLDAKQKATDFSGQTVKTEGSATPTGGLKLEGPGSGGTPAKGVTAQTQVTLPPKPAPASQPEAEKLTGKTITSKGQRIAQIIKTPDGRGYRTHYFESRLTGIPGWMIQEQTARLWSNQFDAERTIKALIKESNNHLRSTRIPREYVKRAKPDNLTELFGLARTSRNATDLQNARALQLHRQLKDIADDMGVSRQHTFLETLRIIEGRMNVPTWLKLDKRATTFRTIKGETLPASQVRTPKGLRTKMERVATPTAPPKSRRTPKGGAPEKAAKAADPEKARLTILFLDPKFRASPRTRNPTLDMNRKAKRVAPAIARNDADRRLQKEWLAHPNQLDYAGIDDQPFPKAKTFRKRQGV